MTPMNETLDKTQRRFWDKVLIGGRGCWLWSTYIDEGGYGRFWLGNSMKTAHTLSYTFWNGNYDHSLDVLHTCDNPSCVNPEHLYLGTHKQNMIDMAKRGRAGRMKLQEQQVKCISALIPVIENQALARWFRISKPTISAIKHKITWHWLES